MRTRSVPPEQSVHLSPGDGGVVPFKADSNRSSRSARSSPAFFPDETARRTWSDPSVPTVEIDRGLESFLCRESRLCVQGFGRTLFGEEDNFYCSNVGLYFQRVPPVSNHFSQHRGAPCASCSGS